MQVATSTSCNPWRFGLFFSVTVPGVPAAQDFKSWKNERENFCRPKDPLGHLQSYHRDEGVFLMFLNVFLMVSQTGWVWRMWVSPTWHSWHLVILLIYIYIRIYTYNPCFLWRFLEANVPPALVSSSPLVWVILQLVFFA